MTELETFATTTSTATILEAFQREPELQELLGYTQGNYALGYYSEPDSVGDHGDLTPPEFALGRKPRRKVDQETA